MQTIKIKRLGTLSSDTQTRDFAPPLRLRWFALVLLIWISFSLLNMNINTRIKVFLKNMPRNTVS